MMKIISFLICVGVTGAALAQTYGPAVHWGSYSSGTDSKIAADGTYLFYNQAQWSTFWSQLTGNPANTAPTDINFRSQMVVAVVAANLPVGSKVMVSSIDRTSPAQVTVKYRIQAAVAGHRHKETVNAYDIVRVDNPAAKIVFSKEVVNTMFGGSVVPGGRTAAWSAYDWDQNSLISSPTTAVLTDQGGFSTYWQMLTGQPNVPTDVNWDSEQLLAIHLGTRPSTGYSIVIDSIARTPARGLWVRYHEQQPDPSQPVAQILTSPFVILRVEKVLGSVKFDKTN
jgi:hypothetical protein